LIVNFFFEFAQGEKIFLNTALFINIVLSFCGLFLYRVIIKQTFELYFSEKKLPAMMRSVGANSVILADKALTREEQIVIVDQCLEYN
jgi:hypothetical protein